MMLPIQLEEHSIIINGKPPYGIILKGGAEYRFPITVEKVKPDSKGQLAGLKEGDVIVSINGVDTSNITHAAAGKIISRTKDTLVFIVKRLDSQEYCKVPVVSKVPDVSKVLYVPKVKSVDKDPVEYINKTSRILRKTKSVRSKRVTAEYTGSLEEDEDVQTLVKNCEKHLESQIGGDKTCYRCKEVIGLNKHISIDDRVWHIHHFNCEVCGKSILREGYCEESGQIMCKMCNDEYFAKKCIICLQLCVDEFLTVEGKFYHIQCFKCANCYVKLSVRMFINHKDLPYCLKCISTVFSINCDYCHALIGAHTEFMEALGKCYHMGCFRCYICDADLTKCHNFRVKDNLMCCSEHS